MARLAIKLGHVNTEAANVYPVISEEDLIIPKLDRELVPGEKKRIRRVFPIERLPKELPRQPHSPGDDDPEKSSDKPQELQTLKDINQLERDITETWISMHQNR